jgi:hypothetical protein
MMEIKVLSFFIAQQNQLLVLSISDSPVFKTLLLIADFG